MELEVGIAIVATDVVVLKPMAIYEEMSVTVEIQDKPVIIQMTISTYVGDDLLTHLIEHNLEQQEEMVRDYPHQWRLLFKNTIDAIAQHAPDIPIWYASQESIRIYCTNPQVNVKDKVSLSEVIINFERNHYPIRAKRMVQSWMTA